MMSLFIIVVLALLAFGGGAWVANMSTGQWHRLRVVLATLLGLFPAFEGFLINQFVVGQYNPAGSLTFIAVVRVLGGGVIYGLLSFIGWALRAEE